MDGDSNPSLRDKSQHSKSQAQENRLSTLQFSKHFSPSFLPASLDPRTSKHVFGQGTSPSLPPKDPFHGITESFKLEKPSQVIESNHQPTTKPRPQVPHTCVHQCIQTISRILIMGGCLISETCGVPALPHIADTNLAAVPVCWDFFLP